MSFVYPQFWFELLYSIPAHLFDSHEANPRNKNQKGGI